MLATAFSFLDVPRLFGLVDHEVELIEPADKWVADLLASCHHPLTQELMPAQAKTDEPGVRTFLQQNPRGHTLPDPPKGIAPGYTFWMRTRPGIPARPGMGFNGAGELMPGIAGSISLRIGHSLNLDRYLGHIGYHVLPPYRGHHFAMRAARLLLPIARAHGHRVLWITCNPDNVASRKSCEKLGATYVDTVLVPRDNSLYSQGDREKCRYRVDL